MTTLNLSPMRESMKEPNGNVQSPAPFVSPFFSFADVERNLFAIRADLPVTQGRVFPSEDRQGGWTIESVSFEEWVTALSRMPERIEFIVYDESILDDDALFLLNEDLTRYAEDYGTAPEVATKAVSALRSHQDELYAVTAYAFLTSGHVLAIRATSELAKLIYNPGRLLTNEGLNRIRKLKNLLQNN
jgi:hypothetical protein